MTTAELVIDELRTITQGKLQHIRKADGLVSVYDVIRAVTGQSPVNCRKIWETLIGIHPELVTICHSFKLNL